MNFINYLNTLNNLNASGVNALAESQQNYSYFSDIYQPFPIVDTLHKLLNQHKNNIIILTGHAGDGKSTIAFDLLKKFDKNKKNFGEYEIVDNEDLHVLKDMSELNAESRKHYLEKAFTTKGNWIIVSNTGPLLTSVVSVLNETNAHVDIESKILTLLSQNIESANDISSFDNLKLDVDVNGKILYIVNIAQLDNIEIALEIFKKMINHSQWNEIVEKYPHHPITQNFLTIKPHLEDVIKGIKLTYLYLLNYERRLTLRQMLAHLTASLTMGHSLEDDIDNTILFSDTFFGVTESQPWSEAKGLKLIELLLKQNIGGYTSLEIEHSITNPHLFDDVCEPLQSIIKRYIIQDNNTYSSKIKATMRRILFMYGVYNNNDLVKSLFLSSPNISAFAKWRMNEHDFDTKAQRRIKSNCLKALNLFYSGSEETKNRALNITLKRSDSIVFQIAQIKICSISERQFSVGYDSLKKIPYFYLKDKPNVRLDLSLPLLDYIDNINTGDISDALNPIYKTQLERFKLNLIEWDASSERDEVCLMRTMNDGSLEEIEIYFEDEDNELKVEI